MQVFRLPVSFCLQENKTYAHPLHYLFSGGMGIIRGTGPSIGVKSQGAHLHGQLAEEVEETEKHLLSLTITDNFNTGKGIWGENLVRRNSRL